MLETLREDFARLPGLLAEPAPPQPEAAPQDAEELEVPEPEAVEASRAEPAAVGAPAEADPDEQLGLF
jgi:hypothetical protein